MKTLIRRDEISEPRQLQMKMEIIVTLIESLISGGFPNPGEDQFRPAAKSALYYSFR